MRKLAKFSVMPAVLMGFVLLVVCNGGLKAQVDAGRYGSLCGDMGLKSSDPCPISFLTLAANPDLFDGKYVRVAGYYSKGLDHLLFADMDSAESAIVANAVLLSFSTVDSQLDGLKPERPILVEGKFFHSLPTRGEFNVPRARGLLGELAETKRIRGVAVGIPYRCWGAPAEQQEAGGQGDSYCP
jgi:hypothetical protein